MIMIELIKLFKLSYYTAFGISMDLSSNRGCWHEFGQSCAEPHF